MLTLWKGKTGKSNNDLTLTSEDELENKAIDSPNKNIESYILSLDGDDEEDNDVQSLDNSGEDEEEEESELEIEEVLSTKLIKLKSESPYTNNGPDAHAPTTANYEKLEAEIELVDEVIDAPWVLYLPYCLGHIPSSKPISLKPMMGQKYQRLVISVHQKKTRLFLNVNIFIVVHWDIQSVQNRLNVKSLKPLNI